VDEVVQRIRAERSRLLAELPAAQPRWQVYPSVTNFLLVRTPGAAAAWEHLRSRGVLVRRQDHYAGLEGCLRISVGTRSENDALLDAARDAP
jgi:histidinol-phosphate aminotransferase